MQDAAQKTREDIGVVFDELPFAQTLFVSHLGRIMKGIYQNWDQKQYEEYLQKVCPAGQKGAKGFFPWHEDEALSLQWH